jgi:competence protein ComEA
MEYFNFTKKERTGMYVLLAFILLLIIVPLLLPFFVSQQKYDVSNFKASIARLRTRETDTIMNNNWVDNVSQKVYANAPTRELFYFDPNTLSAESWKKLGVRDKTICTIQNYLSKGGKFYKPADISKIWGFTKEQTEELVPYVKIVDAEKPSYKQQNNGNVYTLYKKENKTLIDINTADTTAFIALPGIANKLANRIVEFRNKLGGFYSVDQVGETFGLRDSVFQLIKPKLIISNTPLVQFDINTATTDQLKVHPYIHYAIANAIVQYRLQHGNYSSVADIKKIVLISNDAHIKMAPYLKVN